MTETIDIPERIEKAAWADVLTAAPEELREELGLRVERLGRTLLLASSAIDSILLNRAIGGGPEELARVACRFAELGIERFFLQPSAPSELEELKETLGPLGLAPYRRRWVKFLRRPEPPPHRSTSLPIRRARPGDAGACAEVIRESFELPAAFDPLLAGLVGRPRWHVYAAYDAGEPVSVGVLFVEGETATCAFGATRPTHRQLGAQGALMAHRIRVAAELGCRWITTETGELVEGEPNHSYKNMLRCGFDPIYWRPNFAPEGFTWTAAGTSAEQRPNAT